MAEKLAGVEAAAINVLKRAVELDTARKLEEAVTCYQEGLQLLLEVLKNTQDANKKQKYREKMTEYMGRAEQLKTEVAKDKEASKHHEQIHIENDSVGHSYEKLFSRLLDEMLTEISMEDPYIRSTHQIYNFLRFCELIVKSKSPVSLIRLTTGQDEAASQQEQQQMRFDEIARSLQQHNIRLDVTYSSTMHDREIRFNNGWIIKIGRGLDIYKASKGKFSVGFCDFDLRRCHETTVDIFHSKYLNDKPKEPDKTQSQDGNLV